MEEGGGRALTPEEEEEGSRHIQVVGRENLRRISLPGLLWPAGPGAGWPGSVCLALAGRGVHLKGLWVMEGDMVRKRRRSVAQTC